MLEIINILNGEEDNEGNFTKLDTNYLLKFDMN